MLGHNYMLPLTIIVVSHIMTICPSSAAPQHLMVPGGMSNGRRYMDLIYPSSPWEMVVDPAALENLVILSPSGVPISTKEAVENAKAVLRSKNMAEALDTGKIDGEKGMINRSLPIFNTQNSGSEGAILIEPIMEENMDGFMRSRNVKRSPRCLRRCLAQGLLHPSQCHSLC